jgi:hypothetical protein
MRGLYRAGEDAGSGSSGEARVPDVPIVPVMHRAPGLVLVTVLAVGCHTHPIAPSVRPTPTPLPLTARTPTEPDVSALPLDASPITPTRPTSYRRLTADDCRALAIRNAPLADELDTHPDNTPSDQLLSHKHPASSELPRLVRGYAADEIRNRAAAEALEDYYKLAAAEGQFDLAASAHAELRTQLASAEKAIASGLKDRGDLGAIRRQVLETQSQLAKLEAGIAALNVSLAGRLGLNPADPTPLWPADALRVRPEDGDVEQAVVTGLHYRLDLNLLRTLARGGDHAGELTNAVLTGVNPLLGHTDSASPLAVALALLKKCPTQADEATRRQVLGLLATRERQAEAEIRADAAVLRGARAAVVAKAAEVRSQAERVAEQEKKVAAGVAGAAAELAVARLDHLKAKGELVQAVADWQLADVKLRQVTGILVRE